jgi:hypothetical protein
MLCWLDTYVIKAFHFIGDIHMGFDDDFFNDYDSDTVGSSSGFLSNDQGGVENILDPFNLHNPVNAYLFLSDDAQDELGNTNMRKMKCPSCGHKFLGQKSDYCPICYGAEFREII